MSESKIEIKIGEITFSGEGDKVWLSEQLDKILDNAKELIRLAPAQPPQVMPPASDEEADLSNAT